MTRALKFSAIVVFAHDSMVFRAAARVFDARVPLLGLVLPAARSNPSPHRRLPPILALSIPLFTRESKHGRETFKVSLRVSREAGEAGPDLRSMSPARVSHYCLLNGSATRSPLKAL